MVQPGGLARFRLEKKKHFADLGRIRTKNPKQKRNGRRMDTTTSPKQTKNIKPRKKIPRSECRCELLVRGNTIVRGGGFWCASRTHDDGASVLVDGGRRLLVARIGGGRDWSEGCFTHIRVTTAQP